jgi:hypothetical protein
MTLDQSCLWEISLDSVRKKILLPSQFLRSGAVPIPPWPKGQMVQNSTWEMNMNVNEDLVGKTITGVIASQSKGNDLYEIWVLQFADGSHVEFVSPGARKALRRAANQGPGQGRGQHRAQVSKRIPARPSEYPEKATVRLANSHSMRYQRELEAGAQLTLNVA